MLGHPGHVARGLAVAVFLAAPAFAKDCGDMAAKGRDLIATAGAINVEIAGLDPADAQYAEKKKQLRDKFRRVRNDFYTLQVTYGSPPPCGTGDLEDDLGKSFPPMGSV